MAYSLISKKEIKERTSDAAKQFFFFHMWLKAQNTPETSAWEFTNQLVMSQLSCLSFIIWSEKAYPVPFGSYISVARVVRATHKHTGCWNVSWAYCFCRSAGSTTCIQECISSLILQTSGPMNLTQQVMQSSNGADVGKGTRPVKSGQISPTC